MGALDALLSPAAVCMCLLAGTCQSETLKVLLQDGGAVLIMSIEHRLRLCSHAIVRLVVCNGRLLFSGTCVFTTVSSMNRTIWIHQAACLAGQLTVVMLTAWAVYASS